MKPAFPFAGTPAFNTIDYFVVILLVSVAAGPLSCVSRNRTFQRILHIGFGSVCLFSVAPRLLFFYLAIWIAVYVFTGLARASLSGVFDYARIILPIAAILLPMVWWKVHPLEFESFLNVDLNALIWKCWPSMGEVDSAYGLVAPLGLSFSVFRAIDTIVECYVGVIDRVGILDVLAYGLFAPVQIVGPIMQFREMELVGTGARVDTARWGALQIAVGLVKVFILAWPLAWSDQIVSLFPTQNLLTDWAAIMILPLFLFLNFSGFSDMSIGVAAVFGYRLAPNFNDPLRRTSLQQFWANWHMSLTRFAQRNVFVPIVGTHKQRQHFGILCTMMVIALWHNLSIALVLFGALHGGALVLERMWRGRAARDGYDQSPRGAGNLRGWAMMYLFLALTVPLLLLRDADILHFYTALIGAR